MTTKWTNAHEDEYNRLIALRKNAKVEESVVVLGHTFKPMERGDWECYGGAEEGTLICTVSDTLVLLWHPATKTLSEMAAADNVNGCVQRDWSFIEIM